MLLAASKAVATATANKLMSQSAARMPFYFPEEAVANAKALLKAMKIQVAETRVAVGKPVEEIVEVGSLYKVIVVTGATAGIGEDTAIKLAKGGAIVILAARTPEKLDATMAKIKADGGKVTITDENGNVANVTIADVIQ